MHKWFVALAVAFAAVPAIAMTAIKPGDFRITSNEAEARAFYQAAVASGVCAAVGISVDRNGVWLVSCKSPNGGDDVPSSE